jgi:hypothetical protein
MGVLCLNSVLSVTAYGCRKMVVKVVVVRHKLLHFENLNRSGSRPRRDEKIGGGFMASRDRRNAIVVELVVQF